MSQVEDDQLTDGERELLALADEHLRAAVVEYQFVTETAVDRARIERAQVAVATAEDELWRLRASLLRWQRPSWAPSASLVADWFSPEDASYDEVCP